MKLIYEIYWNIPYTASGVDTIPFEYSSKEDFQYYVLEEIKKHKENCILQYGKKDANLYYRNGCINVLGKSYNVGDLEDSIENRLYTLDEWFEKKKVTNL